LNYRSCNTLKTPTINIEIILLVAGLAYMQNIKGSQYAAFDKGRHHHCFCALNPELELWFYCFDHENYEIYSRLLP